MADTENTIEAHQEVKPKFRIQLITERCKGCTYCIEFCPKGVLKVSPQINSKGYHLPYATNQENCVGCKMCQSVCPDFCIYIEKNN